MITQTYYKHQKQSRGDKKENQSQGKHSKAQRQGTQVPYKTKRYNCPQRQNNTSYKGGQHSRSKMPLNRNRVVNIPGKHRRPVNRPYKSVQRKRRRSRADPAERGAKSARPKPAERSPRGHRHRRPSREEKEGHVPKGTAGPGNPWKSGPRRTQR